MVMAAIYAFGVLWLAVTLHWDRVDRWHHDNPVRTIREDEHPVTFSEAYERNSNN